MGFKSILLAIPFDKRFKGVVSAIKRLHIDGFIIKRFESGGFKTI
jgi:hypothetical protein